MEADTLYRGRAAPIVATLCRLESGRTRWRVNVEAWPAGRSWRGRFVFAPDDPASAVAERYGPPWLRGESGERVVASAYDVPERRLRELVHSLG